MKGPDPLRLIVDGPGSGVENMAVDECLMAAARSGRVALRFYGFSPPCLSLGRNERARGAWDEMAAARAGVDIVRRPTGGRSVFHSAELTYAVVAPAGRWGGLRESYRRIHAALVRGLAELDVDVRASAKSRGARRAVGVGSSSPGRDPGPEPAGERPSCFGSSAASEVVAGGRKLIGSAQWRHEGALLQHGSLLLRDDQGRMEALRAGADEPEGPPDRGSADPDRLSTAAAPAAAGGAVAAAGGAARRPTGAVGLEELMQALPPLDVLIRALTRGFVAEFGLRADAGSLTPAESARAAELESRYRSRDWTWRR